MAKQETLVGCFKAFVLFSPVTQQIQNHFSLAWATLATQKTLISGYFKSLEQSENSLDEAQ